MNQLMAYVTENEIHLALMDLKKRYELKPLARWVASPENVQDRQFLALTVGTAVEALDDANIAEWRGPMKMGDAARPENHYFFGDVIDHVTKLVSSFGYTLAWRRDGSHDQHA